MDRRASESPIPHRRPTAAALGLALLLSASSSGCVRFYQPMSGLHRPVVVDVGEPNFRDVRLLVRCVPGELLSPLDASILCRRVGALFENQGALVELTIGAGRPEDDGSAPPEGPEVRADLTLELRSREVHRSTRTLSWIACAATFTLLPGVSEWSFAQDVAVRDGSGFLVVSDSLEGRVITRFGAGPWVGNAVLDLARPKDERLGGDAAGRDLSRDLYRQLSQLVFNGKIHAQVLSESAARGTP